MNETNPFSPPTVADCTDGKTGRTHRLRMAAALGCVAALAGPAFLIAYYEYHGIGLGLSGSIVFFGAAYLTPAFVFLFAGIASGVSLSAVLPTLHERSARIISILSAGTVLSAGIVLLLTGLLNFGLGPEAFALPAFSVVCGAATFLAASTYLALT